MLELSRMASAMLNAALCLRRPLQQEVSISMIVEVINERREELFKAVSLVQKQTDRKGGPSKDWLAEMQKPTPNASKVPPRYACFRSYSTYKYISNSLSHRLRTPVGVSAGTVFGV